MAIYTIEDTTITNIADAIREKNGSTNKYNPSQMPDAIRAIETGGSSSDEWQPQSDWWDVESIINNDSENYIGKIIFLLPDSAPTSILKYKLMNNAYPAKIKTSDGKEYTPNADLTHVWDVSKDKKCSKGYSTRYVMYYYNVSEAALGANFSSYFCGSALRMIVKNMNLTTANQNHLQSMNLFDLIMIGGKLQIDVLKLGYMKNIRKIVGLDISKVTSIDSFSASSFYAYDFFKDYGEQWNTTPITNFNNSFNDTGLVYIPSLDFANVTAIGNMFNSTSRLMNIGEISNIKISGININQAVNLNHDTLLRFLNALHDYASEGDTGTYTITFGNINLSKLTDEEKAIATNKGWTLA